MKLATEFARITGVEGAKPDLAVPDARESGVNGVKLRADRAPTAPRQPTRSGKRSMPHGAPGNTRRYLA